MQTAQNTTHSTPVQSPVLHSNDTSTPSNPYSNYQIIRRNGAVVPFEPNKIAVAMMKAFLAVHGTQGAASASVRETVDELTQAVMRALMRSRPGGGTFHIEDVQDQAELGLMRGGHHEIARAYVLYREKRTQERARQPQAQTTAVTLINVIDGGQKVALDIRNLQALIEASCANLGTDVKAAPIVLETMRNLYDGVPIDEVYKASILAARTLIEKDPDYTYATARLLMHTIRREVLGGEVTQEDMATRYAEYFPQFIAKGVQNELLDEKLQQFDLARLGAALKPERDLKFDYLGLQTLFDRYFLHVRKQRIELPQAFFMRVAMGLSLNEINREERAIEFYEILSSFDFMSSTPTLFNAGTLRSQLSSCYLTTVADDLGGIYDAIKENALLSKFAGGLGNDWTPVRALGAHIKGTNGESQGVVPFLKVVNDTAVAVNQGGKRKGAVCAYLETWHLDIEEFLELIIDPEGIFYRAPSRARGAPQFDVATLPALPRVDIVYSYAGADAAAIDAAVAAGARGLVVAGVGRGNSTEEQGTALERARAKGVAVVMTTRTGAGRVPGSARRGFVGGGDLNAQKARVLLMLALTRTTEFTELDRIFAANQ